jgi:uncharacterized membrane protein
MVFRLETAKVTLWETFVYIYKRVWRRMSKERDRIGEAN